MLLLMQTVELAGELDKRFQTTSNSTDQMNYKQPSLQMVHCY
jgi:hypothetical protein